MKTEIEHKTKYKNSPLGLIPEDWEVKALGDFIKLSSGKTKPDVLTETKILNHIYPVFGGNGIIGFSDKFNSVGKVILIGRVGEKCGITRLVEENCWITDNALFTKEISNKININFLAFKLQHENLSKLRNKGGQPLISQTPISLQKVAITLNIPEQTAIANCLSTWDKAIAAQTQLIAQKELRKKALSNRLLTGKVRLKGFEKNKWSELKGDKIFRNNTDKTHNGELEILSASQERGIVPRSSNNIDIKFDVNSLGSYKKVEVGDYVISLRSFQGGIEYSEYEGIVSPAYTILKENVPISKVFFKVYFKTETFINRLNTIIYGIRDGKQISFKDFATLKLPYPSIEEQIAIAEVLQCADEEIQLLKKKLQKLKDQKKGLMQILLMGKKRLKY